MHRLQTLVAVACALIAAVSLGVASSDAATQGAELGVYRGPANPTGVAEFGTWLGREPTIAVDFLADDTWAHIASPVWWATRWGSSPYRMVYSVPLIPDTGGSLAEGATGAYNAHFAQLARTLVAHGDGDAIIRLGWEFNLHGSRWNAAGDPAAFVAYWRQAVQTMRAVPGARFQFDWCPNRGRGSIAPEQVYPGNAYVDYIGMDSYDAGWGDGWQDPVRRWHNALTEPYGLNWHRDFAKAHGKPMTYPEWGLWIRPDGHGGGDNPYYIEKMREWIAANDVAYHAYFEYDEPNDPHRLMTGRFPLGAAAYKAAFSSAALPAPTPPPAQADQPASPTSAPPPAGAAKPKPTVAPRTSIAQRIKRLRRLAARIRLLSSRVRY